MKLRIIFLTVLFISAFGGISKSEVSESELYGEKRVDCTQTKGTNEAANIMQCPKIRADDKEIEDKGDLQESYSPDNYNNIY